ncbi:tb-292 membrane associated protein-like protein [Novymonas esmeraldas]|uniref:Tb-292 membrane associated protein-like protein n=1 Tax=Novymonas esmeraldas TaxID=1808958 RepID=A0AAW0EYI8_9TRYP
MAQPAESAAEQAAVEARLRARAAEVARERLAAEAELRAKYPTVAVAPEAALLSSLALPLDPRLALLEQQRATLVEQPAPDRAALRATEEAVAARVQEMVDEDAAAETEAAQARAAVLRQYPMCARDVTEAVGKDAMFASLAARRASLLASPAANAAPLRDVEDLMRERGAEVESKRRRRRRPAHPPRLLDMNDVALESGEQDDYHTRRHRHRRGRILDAREVPMDVAGEVHEGQDETKPLPKSRHVAALRRNDPYYQELVALRDALVREDEAVNAGGIRCVEEQMKDRAAQLGGDAARARAAETRAEAALRARYPFLGATVTGEMLTAVGLEDDAVFAGMAAEHAALKAAPATARQALADAEQAMRARASELVAEHAREEEALRRRMPFVGALPGGVTLRELDVANDPDVRPLLAQLEELAKDAAAAEGPEARRLEKAISELVQRAAEDEAERTRHRLVDAEGLHERFLFLPEEPARGVALIDSGVAEDPEFRTLANALVDLRRAPETTTTRRHCARRRTRWRAAPHRWLRPSCARPRRRRRATRSCPSAWPACR